ncbi:Tyrosine kinase family catalytic domain protein [Ceratobasidium sp. AG-Ba]|nr:Tyrosine kinase family catalytic domain protein [Ceratobasidium sp. AG-Ba]QRW13943.1 Tyrosine kinase family catalytic domain protein [Ceratobasidium sp. AG-Ba]
MARTLQTARISTGGKAARKQIAGKVVRKKPEPTRRKKQTARKSTGGTSSITDPDSVSQDGGSTIVVTSAELIPRVSQRRTESPSKRRSARLRLKGGETLEEDIDALPPTATSQANPNNQPFYPNTGRPRPFLPFARFDNDPDLLSSIQDLNVPLLADAVWQPNDESQLRGGFGYVERASWNKQQVAVKFLKSSQTVSGSFRRELTAWKKLAHPNILPFIGVVCVDNMYLGMVSPYMSNGSAPKYLANNPDADVLQILHDVAEGMSHLAAQSPPIAHGDLKGANVLIDDDGRACICDFGLSRFMKDFMSIDTTFGGTIRWMAPEQLRADSMVVSLPADIFSWGMLALELITGAIPWPDVQQDSAVILKVAAKGQRPARPVCQCEDHCGCLAGNDGLWDLIRECWADEPQERPTVTKLCAALERLRA